MTFEDFCRKLLPEPALKNAGPIMREFHRYMSTTPLLDADPLPAKYSKRWVWSEWSHTGADPRKTDYIYLMGRSDGLIKIGTSNDPIRRVAELTSFHQRRIYLIAMWMHPLAYDVEMTAHQSLKSACARKEGREWFRLSRAQAVEAVMSAIGRVETDQRVEHIHAAQYLDKRPKAQAAFEAGQQQAERNRKRRRQRA